ncbi:hypothetical protein [Candidatus Protochlamydia phocaeensis]|uniref:hypothetical protein n=1 Tax=Candidatus Protochlamydia phocaeensis TaxID=1414722 RepID=UPI0008399C8D|nr:hypothetical protein [Candidatus Protochlamydia phocaeensis]
MGESQSALQMARWRSEEEIRDTPGVMVASDQKLEWLLPWWWYHYRKHNSTPVVFADFGMSATAAQWCRQRGMLIDLTAPLDFLVPQDKIAPELAQRWQALFHNKEFWNVRRMCLKKPFAMIQSPFSHTLWTDLDCEVRGSVYPLFETCDDEIGFSIAPQPDFALKNYLKQGLLQPGEKTYNAGVIAFRYQSPVMLKWTQAVIEKNACFPGDSDLLADLIRTEKIDVFELPQIYNWRMAQGPNPDAIIVHWVADWGKQHILEEMKMLPLENFNPS